MVSNLIFLYRLRFIFINCSRIYKASPNIPPTTVTTFRSRFTKPLLASIFYKPAFTVPLLAAAAASSPFFIREAEALNPPTITRPFSTTPTSQMHRKLTIIGSGPAAHTAAIYAARADLSPTLYEGFLALGIAAGGQLTTTDEVENYPGFKSIKGQELMDQMRAQSEHCGTEIVRQTVAKVDLKSRPFRYWLHPLGDDETIEDEMHTTDALIVATGAKARRLGLAGEDRYWGLGVSACAVCDGSLPIFRERPLVVIGGGDSAVEESVYLTKKASKVTVLVRRDQLRASKANVKRLLNNPKIEVKFNTVGMEIKGEQKERGVMQSLRVKNVKNGKEEDIEAYGLFYAVGHEPATSLFKGQLNMDEDGYLITEPGNAHTNVEGVFAAGDVQDKKYRQAVTSAGTGCVAALEAEKWLAEHDASIDNPIETESDARKPKPEANGRAPEYRQNPLL